LSSIRGTASRAATSVAPQASRTPGGHHRHQQQQQQRAQEEQEVVSAQRPRGERPAGNQAPRPENQQNHGQNNDRGRNNEGVATSGVDARDIINARCQGRLSNNADCFQALSSVLADAKYPKDFKPGVDGHYFPF